MRLFILSSLSSGVLVVTILSSSVFADIYRYVDANGVVHFTNAPKYNNKPNQKHWSFYRINNDVSNNTVQPTNSPENTKSIKIKEAENSSEAITNCDFIGLMYQKKLELSEEILENARKLLATAERMDDVVAKSGNKGSTIIDLNKLDQNTIEMLRLRGNNANLLLIDLFQNKRLRDLSVLKKFFKYAESMFLDTDEMIKYIDKKPPDNALISFIAILDSENFDDIKNIMQKCSNECNLDNSLCQLQLNIFDDITNNDAHSIEVAHRITNSFASRTDIPKGKDGKVDYNNLTTEDRILLKNSVFDVMHRVKAKSDYIKMLEVIKRMNVASEYMYEYNVTDIYSGVEMTKIGIGLDTALASGEIQSLYKPYIIHWISINELIPPEINNMSGE